MNGFQIINGNGSVNVGPFSPVWEEGCVGNACASAGSGDPTLGLMITAVLCALVLFAFCAREGTWWSIIKAAIIPVWLLSAVVYHLAS
jgi:hypothetical protein